jgi:hypothetical protein
VDAALNLDGLTPERLTAILRERGHVARGRIERVSVESSRTTLISAIARLRLGWSPDADPALPSRLFFKMSRPDQTPELAAAVLKEVAFYETVAPRTPPGLVPRCYDAFRDPATSTFHLLLEDLAETHVIVSEWPLPPTAEQCARIVDLYARFHAAWWNDPRLGGEVGALLDETAIAAWWEGYQRRYAAFADQMGDRLSPERRRIYERVLAAWPTVLARHRSRRNLTIAQGDAHVWNLLYPRDPADGLRLIDWDGWRIDVGANDLAYMMAVHWYPERRRRFEAELLRRYGDALASHGVTGYGFAALWEDYRLSVVWRLGVPVWQSSVKIGPWIWWSHLERVMLAFDDLGCEELLG